MADLSEKLFALHQSMKKCRACLEEGYEIYPPAVVSGLVSAQFMTIGQAPGITEQEAGRPFNAGSGKRLFDWLGRAGIEEDWFRSTQYMTSVTKCYPGMIIPIGRLAINLFYPKKLKLQEIIATRLEVSGRWVIPLPHSSGASRWHQLEDNRRLIDQAITLIREQREQYFPQ